MLVCKQVNKQLKKEWKWIQDVNTIRIYKEIEWQLSSFFPFSIFYLIGTWGPWRSNKKKMERNLLTFGHIIKKKLESPNVYKRRFHGKESSAQRSDPWAGLIASCGSFGLMVCNRRTRIQLTRIVNFFGHMPGKCADRASGFFLSLFCSRSTSSISWFTLSGIWNSLVKISSLSWSSVRERPFFLAFGLLMSRKKEIRVALLDQRQIIFTNELIFNKKMFWWASSLSFSLGSSSKHFLFY